MRKLTGAEKRELELRRAVLAEVDKTLPKLTTIRTENWDGKPTRYVIRLKKGNTWCYFYDKKSIARKSDPEAVKRRMVIFNKHRPPKEEKTS